MRQHQHTSPFNTVNALSLSGSIRVLSYCSFGGHFSPTTRRSSSSLLSGPFSGFFLPISKHGFTITIDMSLISQNTDTAPLILTSIAWGKLYSVLFVKCFFASQSTHCHSRAAMKAFPPN